MVDVQAYVPANPEEDAWSQISGRSIPKFDRFAREEPVGSGQYIDLPTGTSYTGIVAENPKSYQEQDYDSKEPKFWPSGQPVMAVSVVLDTEYREDEDDDGKRILRLRQNGKAALKVEMDRLGIKRFGVGTALTIHFAGYGTSKSGGRKPKLFKIDLSPAEFVSSEQQQVEQAMTQAGYVEIPQAASFPAATPAQTAAATAAGIPAAAPVAAPAAVQPDFGPALATFDLLVGNGIPRQNAIEAAVKNAGLDISAASQLDTLLGALGK